MSPSSDIHQSKRMQWLCVCFFILGMLFFFATEKLWSAAKVCDTEFNLLSTAKKCEVHDDEILTEWDYEPLREELVERIGKYTTTGGTVPNMALYFRDLKHSARVSIRENQIFEPASLIKLPIMMAILHEADRHPELLDEQMTYDKEDSYRFITGSVENSLKLNSSYTIRELLQKMIQYSDNSSATLLEKKINELALPVNSNAFSDLGTMQLVLTGQLGNTHLISLVNIFVALYNANYLSQESSQFALEILTQTNFDQALVAGVPKDVRVAHKYGIRIGDTPVDSELHDCGIVYHPSTPYVLCILTSGADLATSSSAIQDISLLVYENVDRLKP